MTIKSDSYASNKKQAIEQPHSSAPAAAQLHLTAQAFVSKEVRTGSVLTAQVTLAGQITLAHLDSCASHCFVSSNTSAELTRRGYPAFSSPITFEVMQGNPLCNTRRIHYLPLTLVREDGQISHWDRCLFVVADAGADVIICNEVLRLGGIVEYEPPTRYIDLLAQFANMPGFRHTAAGADAAPAAAADMLGPLYQAPRTSSPSQAMHTVVFSVEENVEGGDSKLLDPPSPHKEKTSVSENENLADPLSALEDKGNASFEPPANSPEAAVSLATHAATSTASKSAQPQKKRKGDTTMLTADDPYGRNPPLPDEVMEAVKHLKLLSDPATTPQYTPQQLEEVRERLAERRPKWAKCLTLQQTMDVADKETEQFINDLMDRPRYQTSIFASSLAKCCDLKEFEIESKPGRDMWNPPQPRRFKDPNSTLILDAWLDALLDNKKCHESNATHPAPVTIVFKAGRDPRVCVDYRNRNARSEIPIFPMPDVQDFLDDTEGFKYYCSFDMAKMFNQFRIKKEHQHLAAFITHRGVYEPDVIMFGLAGGPQHTVRECGGAMAKDPLTNGKDFTIWALEQNAKGIQPPYEICPSTGVVKGSRLRPFIDDVTIPSNHKEGMSKLVELFFEFCFKHNLILSRKKAQIMRRHLRMLGFVVSEQGKHLDPQRIITLLEAKKPQSKESLHSLLCSYTFVRMFIPDFASIVAPLHEAARGIVWKGKDSGKAKGIKEVDPDFIWTDEMIRAFDQLRNALLEAPILVKVDWSYPLFLSVDASLRGEGWVLWQLITTSDGAKVAVAILYGSRKYSDTEKNWETTRQEASAIRSALTDVYDYVFGRHFYLFSDHLNLRFMHNSINRAVIRMRDFLSQFNMTIVHCPGVWNNADSISRLENEALPIELAQNLNSATEAVLEGNKTLISTGTCTKEDIGTEGECRLQPRKEPIPPKAIETDTLKTGVLCTICHESNGLFCLLCNLNEIEENSSSNQMEEDLMTEPVVAFHTTTNVVQQIALPDEYTYDNAVCALCKSMHSPHELLRKEAVEWNDRAALNPRVGLLLQETEALVDAEDEEDLLWCGPIQRRATVLNASAAAFRRGRQASPPELLQVLTNHENTGNLSQQGKDVPAGPQTDEIVITAPKRVSFGPATATQDTQTTPADFRIASITFPLLEDFKSIHNNHSGHHGLEYSYRKLLKRCGSKWANERGEATKVKAALKEFLDACPICQKVRGLKEKIKAKHSFIVSRPFLEVSYDFIVFKREDKYGNRYILVAIDNFLKLVEMKAVKNRDAETVARFLLEIGSRYGPMARLRSDREGAFTGLLVERLNKERDVESVQCIAYHPQANSICERQNGIIMNHLNSLILGCALGPDTKVGWSDLLPLVFSLVNNTPKNPLGISPLSMVYGVFANYDQPLLPTMQANATGSTSNPVDYVEALMAWQTKLLDLAEEIQSNHFAKLEKKFNQTATNREFQVGEFVLQIKTGTGISGKPSTRWIGPFMVMDRRDNNPGHPVLDLMNLTDMKVKEASIEDCRRFNTSWFDNDSMMNEMVKLAATDENEYVVERIVSHRPTGDTRSQPLSKYLFEVKWQDFEETTWEPYSGLKDLDPLEEYSKLHPGLQLTKL